MLARCWATLASATALLAQTAPQPASISGIVTNSVTSEPILRAHVMAHCTSADRQPEEKLYGALSNAKGEFTIAPLPSGNCSLEVQRVGFVAPMQQERFPLGSGAHKENVKLSLIPTGAITGRVVNGAGEPAESFNVTAEMGNGNSHNTTTDEKGEFRLGGLRPGKYRVKAGQQSLPFPPEIRADGSIEMRDATTYYPESLSAKMAQRLDVKAGAEVSGVEIKLVQTPIVKVTGKVTGIPQGAKNVMVNLEPSGPGSGVKPDGTFEIWRLDPGKYTLRAQQWNGQLQFQATPVEIEVSTSNLENLELRMVPPFEIAGQLRFDDEQAREPVKPPARPDGTASKAPPPEPRRVELRTASRFNGQQFMPAVAADDSFAQENMQPGRYRVVVHGVSGYVKSVRAGNTEVDGDVLDLRAGSPGPVTVTLSSNYCEISGTVSDSKGPAADVSIVLAPVEDPTNVQFGHTDSAGAYKIRTPPGKYKLAVMEQDTPWSFQSGNLDDFEGETIELSAGDKITKDLVRK